MDMLELQEALEELLPTGFYIATDERGELVIHTNLMEDPDADGELIDFEGDEDEDNEEEDPDFEQLEDDEDE